MVQKLTQEIPMSSATKSDAISALPKTPASDVKKLGWRGVMRDVQRSGRVVVTNHDAPEAVILSAGEYEAIMQALDKANARDQATLEALRERFDERLKALKAPGAAARLLAAAKKPVKLRGKVKAGSSY
jgi:prevent-host-death family protein